MKKKNIIAVAIFAVIASIICVGCQTKKSNDNQSALDFKEEYEKVNGKEMINDIKYRTLDIDENNPYVKVSIDEIAKKIENNETFYLYVGDHLCPWCRSGLEKMIEVAKSEDIKTIYYVDFWDDDHKEILRDLYDVEIDGENVNIIKTQEATEGYKVLYEAVKEYIQDYTITKDGKDYNVGIKRVFGGDHFYFNKGKCERYVSLRVPSLNKATDELTEEVLQEQEDLFTKFFTPTNVCGIDSNC